MFATYFEYFSDHFLLFLFPLLACGLLLLLTFIFRNFRTHLGLMDYDPDILDTATQNTMSGAYVVLGFVLVLAMTTVSDLENGVSKEATAIKSLERMLVLEGSESALKSREYLLTYTKSILDDEWPKLKFGNGSEKTSVALRNLFNGLDNIWSGGLKDGVIYSKILDQAESVAEIRNNRIFSIQSNLPDTFYIVGLVSLLGVILICSFRLIEATRMRVITLLIQVVMLTMMFSAVVIIDSPYLGDTVTSSEAIEKAYESMVARVLPAAK